MQIDCGRRAKQRFDRLSQWHDWFAWRPVKVGDYECRWLEVVERKCEWLGAWDGEYKFVIYRAKRNAS